MNRYNFKVALQLYSVRDEMEKDFEGTIKKVKDMGYDGVEFAGLFGKNPSEVKAICTEIGIVPISAHVPYYDMLENPEDVLSVYAQIGCKYVAVPYLTPECRPGTEGWDNTVVGIKKIGEAAKKVGIQLLYHNHDFEFVKIGDKYAYDILFETLTPDLLQTEIDTCWVGVVKESPAGYIKKYSGRSPVVHLKDYKMSENGKAGKLYDLIGIDDAQENEDENKAFSFKPVGSGQQNFPEILDAAKEADSEWVVVEMDEPSDGYTTLTCAKMGIDYLDSINVR